MRPTFLGIVGGTAALVIVVASVIVRFSGAPDATADVGKQRAAVERFDALVRSGRWEDVYAMTSEPPARDAAAFAEHMRREVRKRGAITSITVDGVRLIRSRTAPMLEARQTITLRNGKRTKTVTYFVRRGNRWLFAFSADA